MPSTYSIDACRATFLTCDVPETDDLFPVPHPHEISVAQQLQLLSLLRSPRLNDDVKHKAAVHARFSYIENRYGTQPMQPRKTNKKTLERLANPILGFTSTLNALPPDVRQKRLNSNQREFEDLRIERVGRPLVKTKLKPNRPVKTPNQKIAKNTVSHDLKIKKCKNPTSKPVFLTQLNDSMTKATRGKGKTTRAQETKGLPTKLVSGSVGRKAKKERELSRPAQLAKNDIALKSSRHSISQERLKKARLSRLPPIKTAKRLTRNE